MMRAGLLLLFLHWTGFIMAAEPESQGIALRAAATEFAVGGPIMVKIGYRNTTSAPVTLKEPLKTWETQLQVARGDTTPEERPFGKMKRYTTAEGIERRTVEAAKTIELEPNQEVWYDYDVGARWPDLFGPGKVRVRVVDRNDERWRTASNELTWRMLFKPESVEYLLQILADTQSELESREFAVQWLRTLSTDFNFNLEDQSDAANSVNRVAVEDYRAWWQANRESKDFTAKIAAINRAK